MRRRRSGRRRTFGGSVAVLGLGALAVIALIMRRRATTDATIESHSPTTGQRFDGTRASSREPTEQTQQRGREEVDEVLAQDTEKPQGSIREDIRSIIRESISRSRAVDREAPQAGDVAPETRAYPEEGLPIEDYDSLNVKQVAQRLEGLVVEEIERLRDYEIKNKNRRTLIARLDRRIRESPGEDVRILRKSAGRSEREH